MIDQNHLNHISQLQRVAANAFWQRKQVALLPILLNSETCPLFARVVFLKPGQGVLNPSQYCPSGQLPNSRRVLASNRRYKKMETHHLEPDDVPPDTNRAECVDTPSDETPEQRADLGRALHGIFTERYGMRVADRVMPSADELARSANPTSTPKSAPPQKKRRCRPKPKRSPAPSPQEANLTSHEARCTVCSHPERDAIEEEFLHWTNCWDIAREYDINRRAIYRHAHAFHLFAVRNRKLHYALGYLVEEVDRVKPTADAVVRAVHALARINEDGQWIDPPSHIIVSRGSSLAASEAATPTFDVINPQPAAQAERRKFSPRSQRLHPSLRTNGIPGK
jgi:hypothetical protein